MGGGEADAASGTSWATVAVVPAGMPGHLSRGSGRRAAWRSAAGLQTKRFFWRGGSSFPTQTANHSAPAVEETSRPTHPQALCTQVEPCTAPPPRPASPPWSVLEFKRLDGWSQITKSQDRSGPFLFFQ